VCRRYEVTVRDGGTPSRSATLSLVIQVVDVNDERPRFDRSSYYFSAAENVTLGTVIGTVHATDDDASPAFSRVTYSLPQVRDSCRHLVNSTEHNKYNYTFICHEDRIGLQQRLKQTDRQTDTTEDYRKKLFPIEDRCHTDRDYALPCPYTLGIDL